MSSARWKVPDQWRWVEARDVAQIVGGGTPPSKDEKNFDESGIPWLGPADLTGYNGRYISRGRRSLSEQGFARSGATWLPAGAVLFSSRAPIGYCVIAANPLTTNQGFKSWVCGEAVEPEYVRYYLAASIDYIDGLASGTTFREISGKRAETIAFPLAPLAEQRRIVAKLDALTVRIARARAELDRVPVLAERIRAGALDMAFAGDFCDHPVEHEPCERWITSTFYGPRFGKEEYVSNGIPTARTTDFLSNGMMSVADAPQVSCSEKDFAKWGLEHGDLLVTRTGSIGKCAVYDATLGRVLPSAYLIRVRFSKDVLPRFAWMMFASPAGQLHLGVNSRAVTQPNINASAIRTLPFPKLTLAEQVETLEAVDQALARADRMEAEAARARELLDRLEAAILARAFRGELVPQDPNDEPASVLLDRIRAERAAAPKAKRGRKAKA